MINTAKFVLFPEKPFGPKMICRFGWNFLIRATFTTNQSTSTNLLPATNSQFPLWEIFSIIAAERKRREMDPVLETIKQCQRMLEEPELGKVAARSEAAQMTRQRLKGMQEFVEVTNKIFAQFVTNARGGLNKLVTLLLKAL